MKWPFLASGLAIGAGLGFIAGIYATIVAACTWPNVVPPNWEAELKKEAS